MVIRNIPMYQARIPISGGGGGGGRVDLTNRPEENPIVQALQQMIQQKRQKEQDALSRRLIEARIAQMQQPGVEPKERPVSGRVVVGGGKTWLVNPQTGEKRDLGIAAPQGKVGERSISDIINNISKISDISQLGYEGKEGEGIIGPEATTAFTDPLFQELAGKLGLEEREEEIQIPAIDRQWPLRNVPARTEMQKRFRKKVESREAPTPITQALEQEEPGGVEMQAPNGEKYIVPASEVKEAQRHNWKLITTPANLESRAGPGVTGKQSEVQMVPGKRQGELPGVRLPFDEGYTPPGPPKPGVRLPFDEGYTGKERPGVRLPFDEGYKGKLSPVAEAAAEGAKAPAKGAKGGVFDWRKHPGIGRPIQDLSEMTKTELQIELERAGKAEQLQQLLATPGVKRKRPYKVFETDPFEMSSVELDKAIEEAELASKVARIYRRSGREF